MQQAERTPRCRGVPRSEHRGAQILLALVIERHKRQQRQIALRVVVPVKKRELLRAMSRVIGRIEVDRDGPRTPMQPALMPLDDPQRERVAHLIQLGGSCRSQSGRSSAATPADDHRSDRGRAAASESDRCGNTVVVRMQSSRPILLMRSAACRESAPQSPAPGRWMVGGVYLGCGTQADLNSRLPISWPPPRVRDSND